VLKHLKNKMFFTFCLILLLMLLLSMVLAINVGAVNMKPEWIIKIIVNKISGRELFISEWPQSAVSIVWELRMPKVLAAVCIGASLSVSGIFMQALTRNALAEPYILGISSGASTGAVAIMLVGSIPFLGAVSVQAGAFVGALLASILVFLMAGTGNNGTTRLVLTGIALAAIFGALTNLLIFMTPDSRKVASAMFWMTGSLAGIGWDDIPLIAVVFLLGIATAMALNRSLDTIIAGEERAITLGADTVLLKRVLIIASSLITGVMVSMTGVIGFIGLVVPHVSRTVFGSAHRRLIPIASLLGGIFLLLADMLARVLVKPEEMPIGIITALAGAPFFLLLLIKSNYRFGD
jgi:iron complex transport system permease protein